MILKFVINFRYARSPPAGYRDASPQPHKIERRAPPPPRGPRTPPMSPSRRSKTMTPPPGEDGTPPPPPGTSTIQKKGSIGPKNRQIVAFIKYKL